MALEDRNGWLKAFGAVVWIGVVVNMGFALPALFAPDSLIGSLGQSLVAFSYPWLGNLGMLLIAISIFYLPAGMAPERYPTYSWLVVLSRFIAVAFWLWLVSTDAQGALFRPFLYTDLAFGIVLGFLWQMGAAPEQKLSLANLRRLLGSAWSGFTSRLRSPLAKVTLAVLVLFVGFIGFVLWNDLLRARPDRVFPRAEDQFKYGAIGLPQTAQVPYYLWLTMPKVCSDLLPKNTQGWVDFGFVYEPGHQLPVGFSKRQIGYPSVEPNCALCHTATVRTSADGPAMVLSGAPAHELDLEAFQWFLYRCAGSDGFTADKILKALDGQKDDEGKEIHLSPIESAVYRYVIVPVAQEGLRKQRLEYSWQQARPLQGRGRTDTFNPTKINVFHLPDDGSIGTTDLPQVWNQKKREGMWLHWDGNNDEIRQRNFAAAMAIGATPKSVLVKSFNRVTDYLLELPPAKYPLPVDAARAARGAVLYKAQCADCHAFGSPKVGTVTPIEEVGTDRHRLDSFTQALVDKFHSIDEGPFQFSAYRKTEGYGNMPLDGLWARGPYLHHGAVPTLWDLLQAPEKRPKLFYRGYNVFDAKNVGFVSNGPEAEARGSLYDTTVPGNGNQGHLWGTQLGDAEKWDLIEFLKTL